MMFVIVALIMVIAKKGVRIFERPAPMSAESLVQNLLRGKLSPLKTKIHPKLKKPQKVLRRAVHHSPPSLVEASYNHNQSKSYTKLN